MSSQKYITNTEIFFFPVIFQVKMKRQQNFPVSLKFRYVMMERNWGCCLVPLHTNRLGPCQHACIFVYTTYTSQSLFPPFYNDSMALVNSKCIKSASGLKVHYGLTQVTKFTSHNSCSPENAEIRPSVLIFFFFSPMWCQRQKYKKRTAQSLNKMPFLIGV